MNTEIPSSASDALLAERIWIRRLARALVIDSHAADDLAQESWLRLHGRIPSGVTHLRGWLRSGVLNLWRQDRRGAARREGRERIAACGERQPSTDELLARAELSEHLARAVRELPEGTRDVVLLRFYEDLPQRAIAARLGLPTRTVESRLRRGLEQLREKLDRQQPGGRDVWLGGMAALAGTGHLSAPLIAAAAVGVLASGVALWAWSQADRIEPERSHAASLPALVVPASTPEREARSAVADERHSVPLPEEQLELTFHRAGDREILGGLEGRLRAIGSRKELVFTTDSAGRAELPWRPDGWRGSYAAHVDIEATEATREHQISLYGAGAHTVEVPRRGGSLEGIAVDEEDRPVVRAEVLLWREVRRGELDQDQPHLRTTTYADGTFRLEDVNDERGRSVLLVLGARAPGLISDPPLRGRVKRRKGARDLKLVMRPARLVRGRILDASGQLVAGATLAARPRDTFDKRKLERGDRKQALKPELRGLDFLTHSNAVGEFQLALSHRGHRLTVEHPERPSWNGDLDEREEELLIVLGAEVRLTGRVVDLESQPLEGVRVSIRCRERRDAVVTDEAGSFTFSGLSPIEGVLVNFLGKGRCMHVETIDLGPGFEHSLEVTLGPGLVLAGVLRDTAGEPVPRTRIEIRGERLSYSSRYPIQQGLTWETALGCSFVDTNSAGEFRFECLYPGKYRLLARNPMNPEPLAFAYARAGDEEVELRLEAGFEESTTITGIVTDEQTGLAPTSFTVIATRHVNAESGPSHQYVRKSYPESDGRFELRGLDPGYWQVMVTGRGFTTWQSELVKLGPGYRNYEVLL